MKILNPFLQPIQNSTAANLHKANMHTRVLRKTQYAKIYFKAFTSHLLYLVCICFDLQRGSCYKCFLLILNHILKWFTKIITDFLTARKIYQPRIHAKNMLFCSKLSNTLMCTVHTAFLQCRLLYISATLFTCHLSFCNAQFNLLGFFHLMKHSWLKEWDDPWEQWILIFSAQQYIGSLATP